ncbi:uncharacterized protein LOC103517678 isoform X2 [Diaphorina citri]|uniref:Uncharacterized protein LOC103517678 isoform X2 n=1 Tax=Diaphorina citri TaxID=121845 RepID=A0A1S4ELJ2_DIACI|nr:uncharacterized protein LOC103517678 isoform X2 [Diaphorina citri]
MWKFKGNNLFRVALVAIVVLAILMQEVEGRRKILRGRKTITRTYYSKIYLTCKPTKKSGSPILVCHAARTRRLSIGWRYKLRHSA